MKGGFKMPFKSEKIRLPEEYDRRVKITSEQRKEIYDLYQTGLYSWRELARKYGVSKSRIGQIVNPKIGERVAQRRRDYKERYQGYSEKNREDTKEHRRYKQRLFIEGKIR